MLIPKLNQLPAPPHRQTGWPWTEESPVLPLTMPDGSPWPRISIVTPSFNQGQFIEETIRSVLLQGYPNLEYIIIDGGSTDNSVEIIKKYAPWLSYWVSELDEGQASAINKGFTMSSGSILGWVNSDDFLQPNAFFEISTRLNINKKGLIIGGSIWVNVSGEAKTVYKFPTFEEMIYQGKTFIQPATYWTSLLWQKAGPIDRDLYFTLDYSLWLRMVPNADEVIMVEEVFCSEHIHEDQKTQQAVLDKKYKGQVNYEITLSILRAYTFFGFSLFSYLKRLVLWKFGLYKLRGGFARAVVFSLIRIYFQKSKNYSLYSFSPQGKKVHKNDRN